MKTNLRKAISVLLILALLLPVAGGAAFATAQGVPAFTDVYSEEWYFDAVQFVYENGIMTGTSATTFEPYAPLTRAALATILWRMEGEPVVTFRPVFDDVAAGQWYSNAVIWAFDNEIVNGTSSTTFEPDANITREQFATMMYRYADFAGQDLTVPGSFSLNQLVDQGDISIWAMTAMRWAVYTGLMSGVTTTTLVPGGSAIRAQAAMMLMRFIREKERLSADFVLTIWVEEATLPQGESFVVHVELKNNSGEDHEIAHNVLFRPHIPNWRGGDVNITTPIVPRFFEAGSIIRNQDITEHQGGAWWTGDLEPGTHELRFFAAFRLNWGQENPQHILVWSNSVILTVQ